VFENMVLKTTLGRERNNLRVEKLGSEKLHALCSSPMITIMHKWRRIIWTRPGREANGI
jgi:hypothetical protein